MLDKKQKYLQIALNSTLSEAQRIISQIPQDKRIILEAGTPLIKEFGARAIRDIRFWWEARVVGFGSTASSFQRTNAAFLNAMVESLEKQQRRKAEVAIKRRKTKGEVLTPYIVADLKCMDRGVREVDIAFHGGANAAVALGQAPIETLDSFIKECEKKNLDSMIDMMNVEFPLSILRQLKKLPQVIILHRGVDEESFNREKEIPYHEIQRIKSNYDMLISIAGGDTFREVQRAVFNDADIVVVWKSFYQGTGETAKLAERFLKEIR
ncbi:orotidine 5'-phosphate decarboxylase / HUMPS family protein [Patescibacteria group bacterium]